MNATLHRRAIAAGRTALEAVIQLDPNGGPVHLRDGHYVRMQDALGWTVRALNGTLWITQDWDSRDIMLGSGEEFILDRNGIALLWPLGDSEICIGRESVRCTTSKQANDALADRTVPVGHAPQSTFA